MLCTFCYYPLLNVRVDGAVTCSVCRAELKVTVAVVSQPSETWKLEPRRNLRDGTRIACYVCQGEIVIGKEKQHDCAFYRPNDKLGSIKYCPHGSANPGNCNVCRGMMQKGAVKI